MNRMLRFVFIVNLLLCVLHIVYGDLRMAALNGFVAGLCYALQD